VDKPTALVDSLPAIRYAVLLTLALLWWLDFPHSVISSFIGSHFPWPTEKSWKWTAVLVERALIEFTVCAPTVALLVACFRRESTYAAAALAVVFFVRLLPEFEFPIGGTGRQRFLIFVVLSHGCLLLLGTALFSRSFRNAHAVATPAAHVER
jgi:hypothetical protein